MAYVLGDVERGETHIDELALEYVHLDEPGVFADPRSHFRLADLAEVGEDHIHGVVLESLEVLLPRESPPSSERLWLCPHIHRVGSIRVCPARV